MDENIIGGKFSIDIGDLSKGLKEANKLINLSNSEFKAATAGMDKWQDSAEGITAKLKNLNEVTDLQRKKVDALQSEYDRLVADGMDPASKSAVELQTKINKETAALKTNEAEIQRCNDSLQKLELGLEDVADSTEQAGDGFTVFKGIVANLASSVISSAVSKVGELATALFTLDEATEEYRKMTAKLEGSANNFGYSVEFAKDQYKEFYTYLGDDQMATNAITNLMGLKVSTESLTKIADGATAVWASYGDSIPIESLTESINETIQVGKVTGTFADTINWAKISNEQFALSLGTGSAAQKAFNQAIKDGETQEDAFSAALAATTSEQERANIVANFLNSTYGESKRTYDELTKEIREAKEAEAELKESQAELAKSVQPLNTAFTKLKDKVLKRITPALDDALDTFKQSDVIDDFSDTVADFSEELIEMGTKAIPKILKAAEKFMDNFDEIKSLVVGVTSAVIAYKVAMASTQGIMKAVNVLSTAHKAKLLLQQGATIKATAAQLGLNGAMMANPIGLVVGALGALTVGLIAFAKSSKKAQEEETEETKRIKEQKKAIDEMTESINEEVDARKERMKTQQESIDAGLSEMGHYESLYEELKKITDENGKVKKGYEERASFIVSTLNEALGTEIRLNDGIITGYQKIQKEIDGLIAKKKAQIILDSKEENYKKAVENLELYKKNNAEAKISYENTKKEYDEKVKLLDIQKQIMDAASDAYNLDPFNKEKQNNLLEARKKYNEINKIIYGENGLKANLDKSTSAYETTKSELATAFSDMAEYEGMSSQIIAGNYEEVVANYNNRILDMTDTTATALQTNANSLVDSQIQLKNLLLTTTDETQKGILESYLKGNTDQLNALMANLTQQQLTIGEASPEIVGAWKNIAENSTLEYDTYLKGLDPATRERIQNLVKLTNADGTLNIEAWKSLAQSSASEYDKALSSVEADTRNEIQKAVGSVEGSKYVLEEASANLGRAGVLGLTEGLADYGKTGEEGAKMFSKGISSTDSKTTVAKSAGDLAKTSNSTLGSPFSILNASVSGSNVGQGFGAGIYSEAAKTKVVNNATKLANLANKTFEEVEDIHSPSRVTQKYGQYWTLGIAKGIGDEEKTVVSKIKSLANTVNSSLQSKIALANSQISASNNLASVNNASSGPKSVTVNQYNTSPKALSRKEIYRQTKNVANLIATNS